MDGCDISVIGIGEALQSKNLNCEFNNQLKILQINKELVPLYLV